jgi:alanyl-tRNA synthetase
VRRIEAVTGPGAYGAVRELDRRLAEAAGTLRTSPEHLARRIETLLEEKRRLEKQIEQLLREGGTGKGEGYERHQLGDVELVVGDAPVSEREQVALMMDKLRAERKARGAWVMFTGGERPGVHVAVTDDLVTRGVKAGDLVARIAAVSGGKGGGRPQFASGGLGDPARLPETRAKVAEIMREALSRGNG